jgi:DNA-binding response OmpR family regulator
MGAPRILVIDDDENVRVTLASMLNEQGYVADTAETGREAVEKSESTYYNAALIDVRLPDMEGTKLLKMLKKSTPKLIMIILTGYPSLENAAIAVNDGADGYLIKPIKPDELLSKLSALIKKQREEAEYGETKVAEYIETRLRQFAMQPKSVDPKEEESEE